MMTADAMPAFIRESPLRTARRYADADLRGTAKPADIAWLHDNPLMWLRALQRVQRDVESHIAKGRAGLAPLKPCPGEPPTAEYVAAKAEHATRTTGRLHFTQLLAGRIEEVKAIIGPQPMGACMTVGDLVDIFAEIADMADSGDLEAAADKAMFHARKLAKLAKENR